MAQKAGPDWRGRRERLGGRRGRRLARPAATGVAAGAALLALAHAPAQAGCVWYQPWNCPSTNPDLRANYFVGQLTTSEKLLLLDGKWAVPLGSAFPKPPGAIGSGGFVPGIPRLGLPALQESDASLGVANPTSPLTGQPVLGSGGYATAAPATIALAASFDPQAAFAHGAMIGEEAHRKGFNVLLAGGINLTRDPRGGRGFEYAGEDALLAGTISGNMIRGVQSRHVVSTIKHYALNDQETGRAFADAQISDAQMRESDLLAFEIAIGIGNPGAVMCSYNKVNAAYACGNDYLLNQVLKRDWKYPGWVMSDWGAVHSVQDANAGLDQESGDLLDGANGGPFFTAKLQAALANGSVPAARVDDMVHRILRSQFAVGSIDVPPAAMPLDAAGDLATATAEAAEGVVLLKNTRNLLPLSRALKHVVVIGGNAQNGVLAGGGSSLVWPLGGPAAPIDTVRGFPHPRIWDPSPPLAAIAARLGNAVQFDPASSISAAAAAARGADAVILFATQWLAEGADAPSLSLGADVVNNIDQDALIAAVTAANPNTVVVLETGAPVSMPWLGQTAGVLEAWYAGQGGGEAIARVLFGEVDATGRLPVTFPQSEVQLPRPVIDHGATATAPFSVNYGIEGANVGYRWFAQTNQTPLFPFGYGLSYTKFAYANLKLTGGNTLVADFDVTNTGSRAGSDVPQLYLTSNPGPAQPRRLVGFQRVTLAAGATQHVTLTLDNRLLARWTASPTGFVLAAGNYGVTLASNSASPVASASAVLNGATLGP